MRISLVLALLSAAIVGAFLGAAGVAHRSGVIVWADSVRVLDSTLTVRTAQRDTAAARFGRLQESYVEQIVVTQHIRERMLYYAGVVARRPQSAKYMVGWTLRAFAEALPDTTGGR